jgi:hypothetical protein
MCWRRTQLEASIGKQCAGAGRNYREGRVLASNALALDATTERGGYWQAMRWRWMQLQGGAGIGKQCAGARRNLSGYKRDFARVRA